MFDGDVTEGWKNDARVSVLINMRFFAESKTNVDLSDKC